ncbi:MAG: hypothetical protein Q8O43_01205 [Dehalococcoidia bacterium]|nr:hypothetical protein [Dehalococcoidia bacterium]
MKLTPAGFKKILQAACQGTLPREEVLTFRHIIEVAEEVVKTRAYVDYADYQTELLTEVLNGFWPIEKIGFRQYTIRYALKQSGWRPESKPARFYPPAPGG